MSLISAGRRQIVRDLALSHHDIDLPRVSVKFWRRKYWREVNCGDTVAKKCGDNGGKRGEEYII